MDKISMMPNQDKTKWSSLSSFFFLLFLSGEKKTILTITLVTIAKANEEEENSFFPTYIIDKFKLANG